MGPPLPHDVFIGLNTIDWRSRVSLGDDDVLFWEIAYVNEGGLFPTPFIRDSKCAQVEKEMSSMAWLGLDSFFLGPTRKPISLAYSLCELHCDRKIKRWKTRETCTMHVFCLEQFLPLKSILKPRLNDKIKLIKPKHCIYFFLNIHSCSAPNATMMIQSMVEIVKRVLLYCRTYFITRTLFASTFAKAKL